MSFIELVVTLAVVTVLLLIVYSMVEDATKAAMFAESHNDLTIFTQRAVNTLQTEILQARSAFQEDALGASYRAALQLPSTVVVWPDTLLPVIEPTSTLDPDTGTGTDRRTGNSLFIARQLAPLSIKYDDDGNSKTPDVEFLVDRYRFQYYFPVKNPNRSFGGNGYYADLFEARSGEYVDYFQLSSLTAAQMKLIVPKVQAAGITQAWDPGQPLASAFYDLAPAAAGAFAAPLAKPKIAIPTTRSLLPELVGGRISGRLEYSLAFLPPSPKKAFPIPQPLFFYAKKDTSLPTFPGGFEVKIAGPAGDRRAGIRLLLMSNYRGSTYEAQQGFVTASARF